MPLILESLTEVSESELVVTFYALEDSFISEVHCSFMKATCFAHRLTIRAFGVLNSTTTINAGRSVESDCFVCSIFCVTLD